MRNVEAWRLLTTLGNSKKILEFAARFLKWPQLTTQQREQNRFIASALKDSRKHSRYSLCYKNAAFLVSSRGDKLALANISFEGLGIYFEGRGHEKFMHSGHVSLNFLGQATEVFVQQAYVGETIAGYRLVHEDSSSLIFIREIIDALKKGASLQVLNKELLQESLQGDEWTCLHGEGPTDLRIKVDADGTPTYCLLSFRIADEYFELLYNGQSLHLEPSGRLASAMLTVIRYGLNILLGIQNATVAKMLRPVFEIGTKALPTLVDKP